MWFFKNALQAFGNFQGLRQPTELAADRRRNSRCRQRDLLSSTSLGTDIPDVLLDIFCVIKSFVDKRAAAIFAGYAVRDPRMQIRKCARATLLAIDAAKRADDLHLGHVHTYGVFDIATKTRMITPIRPQRPCDALNSLQLSACVPETGPPGKCRLKWVDDRHPESNAC